MKENEYTLQLANNYVEIDRDEMEYVEGGSVRKKWWNSTKWVGRYVDIIIIAVSGGSGAFSIYSAKNYIRSIMGNQLQE
ncbi:hypothetical protein [Clostridium tertium]|uniref:Uncharacterized protein n=1 Tax=Clostridium tertium TaxID=1559 RepID=A0A6N3DU60_9CLOT